MVIDDSISNADLRPVEPADTPPSVAGEGDASVKKPHEPPREAAPPPESTAELEAK